MDISLIILFIIVSIVGNIIKESRKKQYKNNAKTGEKYIGEGAQDYSPRKTFEKKNFPSIDQRWQQGLPNTLKEAKAVFHKYSEEVKKELEMEDFSSEGRRHDIGDTYESKEMPSSTLARATLEGSDLENPEVNSFSNEPDSGIKNKKKETNYYENHLDRDQKGISIKLDKDSLINAIVMSEVLSPPKCRR